MQLYFKSTFHCRILTENKEILAQKKKSYADLARQINVTKEEIDNSKAKLDDMKVEREAQGTVLRQDKALFTHDVCVRVFCQTSTMGSMATGSGVYTYC